MDGRYPSSGFVERRGSAGEAADWALSASAAVSSSYGATLVERELLQRHTTTVSTYTTSQHSTGVFDASQPNSESSTTESSVMNFLASIDSRGLQVGSTATSLLPHYRTPSWQTGTSSSTELFLTGALPASGTFSTLPSLPSFQPLSTFPTRSFASTSALTVQHTTFSPLNGVLSTNDPLLQIKPCQTTMSTAFAFDRLAGSSVGASLPIQSSTYRSAQESAPHLLQPQFNLRSSALASPQQSAQPYGAQIFSSSVERALQRECSVIKHHQWPSSSQSVQHSYLPGNTEVSYQETSQDTIPESPDGVSMDGAAQGNSQLHSVSVSSPGLISDTKTTEEHLVASTALHSQVCSYTSADQKNTSVIANQSQSYTSAQLSNLMSISSSQNFTSTQTILSTFPLPQQEKLPSIYKTIPDTTVSQSPIYSSGQEQLMTSTAHSEGFDGRGSCVKNPSHSPYSHSQGQPAASYYAQRGHCVPPCSSLLPLSNADQDYAQMQPTPVHEPDASLSHKYSTESYSQSKLPPVEQRTAYSRKEPSENGLPEENCGELPLEDVQALQQGPAHVQTKPAVREHMDKQASVIHSSSHLEGHLMGSAANKIKRALNKHVFMNSSCTNVSSITSTVSSQHENLKEPTPLLKASHPEDHQKHDQETPEKQTAIVRLPSTQVLLDYSPMILLQQPLLTSGSSLSKPTVPTQPVAVQFLHMNSDVLNSALGVRGTHQTASSGKQPLVQMDSFSHNGDHEAKPHYTLNSICFPESMLMADEKTILSNVDDILAATVAACGVTPQDFKASDGDLATVSHPINLKGHFQLTENSEGCFSSDHLITPPETVTVDGDRLKNNHKVNETFRPDLQTRSGGSKQKTDGFEEQEVLPAELRPSYGSNVKMTSSYGSEFSQECGSSEREDGASRTAGCIQEDHRTEGSSDGSAKRRTRTKNFKQGVEDENFQPKLQKKSGQVVKRSKCGDGSSSEGYLDGYQQQERIRQIIKDVEEKQPEVKTGFIGSFLDFLKSGPKPNSSPPVRSPNRSKKPPVTRKPVNQLPMLPPVPLSSASPQGSAEISSDPSTRKLNKELQKNLQTLPSFSSDEDESVSKNQDLQKSISSALWSLDTSSEKKSPEGSSLGDGLGVGSLSSLTSAVVPVLECSVQNDEELIKKVPPNELAVRLSKVAIEGLTDEELSDSGGEGMYRERDEFMVRNEDIEHLQVTMRAGVEPPAIWKVQKALLQKFTPELRDGKRVFSATNSYLGYFGDAKAMYRRVYVKFMDTVNKREYVRVCNRKPRCKPMHSIRGSQMKVLLTNKAAVPMECDTPKPCSKGLPKTRVKQSKTRAEPPPKKRKKWKEFTASPELNSVPETVSEDEFHPPVPFTSRFLNTRAMKETFKSFVELLISIAVDADILITLERENDCLLLPHMRKVDGMITDNRRRLLPKLCVSQVLKNALDNFPELSVVTELKTDAVTPTFKVRLSGKAYDRKTMKPDTALVKVPLEYTVEQQKTPWFSLYHSLQHYKYHTYLLCMEEVSLLHSRVKDVEQNQMIQMCMRNQAWVGGLFDRFGELLTQVQQVCH